MRKTLLILLTLNSCLAIDSIDYQETTHEQIHKEYEQKKPVPIVAVEEVGEFVQEEKKEVKTKTGKRAKVVLECKELSDLHAKCLACPIPIEVPASGDCTSKNLRFGTGKGHLLYTLSDTRNHTPVVLLPACFGRATAVFLCGKKKCKGFVKSGFANDCREHWRQEIPCATLKKEVGRAPYFKVIKDTFTKKIDLKNVCKRQE